MRVLERISVAPRDDQRRVPRERRQRRGSGSLAVEILLRAFVSSWPLIVVVSALAAAGASPTATTLVSADLAELARDAGAIVRGRVVDTSAQWTPDRRAIDTVVTLEAESTLKGSLGANVRFVVPGGSMGRYRRIFVGAPQFAVGQHVVVFLGWEGPSYPHLLGMGQGVYRVTASADGAWLVSPPPLVPPPAGAVPIVRGDPARTPVPLAEFEQRVRQLAGAAR